MKQKNNEVMENIRTYDREIESTKVRLKELREKLAEKIEDTMEGAKVANLKDQLAVAQEDLMSKLKSNAEVNNLMEEIATESDVLKGQNFHLSNHLVAYFAQTQQRQVQMDEEGHARDVVLSAKLGKEEHQFQTSLLNPANQESLNVDEENKK